MSTNNPFFYLLLIVAAVNFAIGLWALLQRRRSIINWAFFMFVAGATVWISSVAFIFLTKNFVFNQGIFYGGTLMFSGLIIFAKVFPFGGIPNKSFWLTLAPMAIIALLTPFNLFVSGLIEKNGTVEPVNGPLMPFYAIAVSLSVAYGLILIIRNFLKATGLAKRQIQYLLLGLGVFMVSTTIADAILPTAGFFKLNTFGPISSSLFIGLTAYAIVKHQLMDIRIVIQRGFAYAALLGAATGIYMLSNIFIAGIFHGKDNLTVLFGSALSAIFAIFSIFIVEKYFRLEERVRQRTAQLQSLQENQRQMMVDISHGLQTPLTIAKSQLDCLKKQLPGYQSTGVLEKSISEISKFVYDLLDLARLESNQEDFKKQPVDLSKLLEDLAEYFDVVVREHGIKLVKSVQPGIIMPGQEETIKGLVTNLVSNAVKYMSDRPDKEIFIGLRRLADNIIELKIKDNGIGIGSDDLPHLFNRFYRVKNRPQLDVRGTGLGLAICKKIVEKHNGSILAESELGKGTEFTVTF